MRAAAPMRWLAANWEFGGRPFTTPLVSYLDGLNCTMHEVHFVRTAALASDLRELAALFGVDESFISAVPHHNHRSNRTACRTGACGSIPSKLLSATVLNSTSRAFVNDLYRQDTAINAKVAEYHERSG